MKTLSNASRRNRQKYPYVLDIIRNNAKSVVWSPDADVLILLMDLVASRSQFTSILHLLTGIGEVSQN